MINHMDAPHPIRTPSAPSLQLLGDWVVLIHMNHTNPVWDHASKEARHVKMSGFEIGRQGDVYVL